MDVMVLGHNGMLGHMVRKYLLDKKYKVYTTDHRYPSEEFKNDVLNFKGDYVINCIGAIPQKTKSFEINFDLPIWLENNANTCIVHPGTDCEMDEDSYGVSKRSAKLYLIQHAKKTKIIKASIIGPELKTYSSLLEWFLRSENEVQGYSGAMWNGITTYEWAKQCEVLINNWKDYDTETIVYSECISKYDLLQCIKKVFDKDIIVTPNDKVNINKCLTGKIKAIDIFNQLSDLKNYYYDSK
jgi:dTDP-4-dehydrorhamnose reductase